MEWKKTTLNKEDFVKLAKAYIDDYNYFELKNKALIKVAKENNREFHEEFFYDSHLNDAVIEVLGSEFEYFLFECYLDFERYNSGVEFKDGSHPNAKSLEDLWELSK